jgi:phage terminase large subunit-like protein
MTTTTPPTIAQQSEFAWYRWFAAQSLREKQRIVRGLSDLEALRLTYTWEAWARDKQLACIEAPEDWVVWLILAGRGFGKTRTGAQWVIAQAAADPHARIALVGRTAADVRDVMVDGESGILASSPPWFKPNYEPSKRRLTWPNGAIATTFSSEEPNALRGPQHHFAWADEPAAWKYPDTWDQLLFGLRLGQKPQVVATTTPRATKFIKNLAKATTTHVTRGTTYENKVNLAPTFLNQVVARYEKTRLGRQELLGQILDDAEGALWKREPMIEALRVIQHPDLKRIIVGVDPSVNDGSLADSSDTLAETGIIVGGRGIDDHGYVLDDNSLAGSPLEWAREAVTAYYKHKADRIVAEANNGGALVEVTIRVVDKHVSYKAVHASRGKLTRAEPISSLYEQGLMHHVGCFPDLEDQMCNYVAGAKSPDRMDALVWMFTELFVEKKGGGGVVTLPASVIEQQQKQRRQLQQRQQNPFAFGDSQDENDTSPFW